MNKGLWLYANGAVPDWPVHVPSPIRITSFTIRVRIRLNKSKIWSETGFHLFSKTPFPLIETGSEKLFVMRWGVDAKSVPEAWLFLYFCMSTVSCVIAVDKTVSTLLFEPVHDKPTKWHVRPAKTQISLGSCPVWSVFAVCMKKALVLSYPLTAQQRLWSDWVDAQADLSLCWAQMPFCRFCHVLTHFSCSSINLRYTH